MTKYRIKSEVVVELEIDDAVMDVIDDEWRELFYDLRNTGDILEHLIYNSVIHKRPVCNLDGWADQEPDALWVRYCPSIRLLSWQRALGKDGEV